MQSLPERWRPLAHPVAVLAVVGWLVNDHWAKAHYGNGLTGKLSDVAGLVVLPLLILAILPASPPGNEKVRRRWTSVAIALSAGFFTALNTIGWFERWIESALGLLVPGSTLTADRTDLLTLPVLIVPWWLATRTPSSTPARVYVGRAVFLVGAAACVATGGPGNSAGRQEGLIGTPDGFEFFDDDALWTSPDGIEWTEVDAEPQEPERVGARVRNWPAAPVAVRYRHVCAGLDAARHCWDIVDERSAITHSIGGADPVVEFLFPPDRERFRNIDACRWLPKVTCSNRIQISSIAVSEIDGETTVIAAVNRSGGLRRGTTGTWEPFTLGDSTPTPLETSLPQIEHVALIIAAAIAGSIVAAVARVPARVEQSLPLNPGFAQNRTLHAKLLGWGTGGLILFVGWWPIRAWAGSVDNARGDAVQSSTIWALVLFGLGLLVAIALRRRPVEA